MMLKCVPAFNGFLIKHCTIFQLPCCSCTCSFFYKTDKKKQHEQLVLGLYWALSVILTSLLLWANLPEAVNLVHKFFACNSQLLLLNKLKIKHGGRNVFMGRYFIYSPYTILLKLPFFAYHLV